MLETLVQQRVEDGVPPSVVECRSRVQDVVAVVVAALWLKENRRAREPKVSVVQSRDPGLSPKEQRANERMDFLGKKMGEIKEEVDIQCRISQDSW